MLTERQVAEDLLARLRAVGFAYGDNNDELLHDTYDTQHVEISMEGMRLWAHEYGWSAERYLDDGRHEGFSDGTYQGAMNRFVQFVMDKYPDRIKPCAITD